MRAIWVRKSATGNILFFIDADVCVTRTRWRGLIDEFTQDPQLDALIGSYDDSPQSQDFLSQYKNLMHCYTHQNSQRQACTFWSGCGAIKKAVFEEHSGFSVDYERPAIEDIELGYRLASAKRKVVLDPRVAGEAPEGLELLSASLRPTFSIAVSPGPS